MHQRCELKTVDSYSRYGGRGITVCDEWADFGVFAAWALVNGYNEGLQIDREDNDGNYEPLNCRWLTPSGNSNNRRTNKMVEAFGEIKTLKHWSEDERCAVNYSALSARLRLGWPAERAIIQKPRLPISKSTACSEGHPYPESLVTNGDGSLTCVHCRRRNGRRSHRRNRMSNEKI